MSDIKFPKDERGVEYYDPAGENNITGGQISDEFEPLLCPICGKNTIGRNQPPECQHTRREIFEYANALLAKIEKAKEALRKIADTVNPQEQQDYMTARDCLRKLEEK